MPTRRRTLMDVPRIRVRDSRDVPAHELPTYKRLSLPRGSLYSDLLSIQGSAAALLEAHLLDIILGEEVVAWALAVWEPGAYYPTFKVYVDPSHRRRGYATLLYNKATEVFPNGEHYLQTFPHDLPSTKFFSSVDSTPSNEKRSPRGAPSSSS